MSDAIKELIKELGKPNDQENDPPTPEGNTGEDKNEGDNREQNQNNNKTFNQEEVTRMMTREKQQGRSAAFRALGFESEEEALAFINENKKKDVVENNQNKDNDNDNTDHKLEYQRELEKEKYKVKVAEVKAEAAGARVLKDYIDDITTLAMARVNRDDNVDIVTVISDLKSAHPNMFEEEGSSQEESKGKKGTGGSLESSGNHKNGKDPGELGKTIASSVRQNKAKKKYFN